MYLFFSSYGLARSIVWGWYQRFRLRVNQPKSVYTAPTETRLLFLRRER